MTDELSPELRHILAAERSRPGAPGDAKELARAQLAALLGPAAGLGSPPGTRALVEQPPSGATALGTPQAAGVRAASTGGLGLARLAGAFVLGGAVTAGVLTAVRPPVSPARRAQASSSSSVEPPVSSPAPAWTAVPSPPAPAASPVAPAAPPSPPRPAPAPAPDHADRDLAGERILLERARSALARGNGEEALAALDQHARAYKTGKLAEEREALSIQALVTLGRRDDARERAARFRSEYPRSVFLAVIDEVLR